MKDLLEAGVHFGHKSSNWDPRMRKYIFMKRKGVHIIDLQETIILVEQAYNYVKNMVANGGQVLFVGTKKQAKQSVQEAATACGQYYISKRWVGGLLTNFKTAKNSIQKLNEMEAILSNDIKKGEFSKKQLVYLNKEKVKLENIFGGVKKMDKLPALLFVVDVYYEQIAVREANKMGIPVVALVDTNSNPEPVDVVIPGNDDAIRAISLFTNHIAEAVKEGLAISSNSSMMPTKEFSNEENGNMQKDSENKENAEKENPPSDLKVPVADKKSETKKNDLSDSKTNVDAKAVKELREITNIGMMKCKEALIEAGGDKEEALKILKEKGLAVAAKRADRTANEGQIFLSIDDNKGYMASVCCETDFVAKSEGFLSLVSEVGNKFKEKGKDYIDSTELKNNLVEMTAKIGEKIEIQETAILESESGVLQSYLHSNGKVGVLVEIICKKGELDNEKILAFGKDVAMQIAAMRPIAVTEKEIALEQIEDQRAIFKSQMADSNKPADILSKIIDGKIKKYFSEFCLMDMDFIKDGKLKIKDLVANLSKDLGSDVVIKSFKRFQIGK